MDESSFWFAPIRKPDSRALSMVFFRYISWYGREPTDEEILKRLPHPDFRRSEGQGGFMLNFLNPEPLPSKSVWKQSEPTVVQHPERIHDAIRNILNKYSLLMVTDRMDESVTAFSLITGMPFVDVLYLSGKRTGGYWMTDANRSQAVVPKHTCIKLKKSFRSPAVAAFLESPEWTAPQYGDYVLHGAANRSLDLTIDRLGTDRFQAHFQEFQRLLQRVADECDVVMPCSSTGELQYKASRSNCYQLDFGCGYPCMDRIKAEMEAAP